MEINSHIAALGTNQKPGSSVDPGVPYQDIPKLGISGHRNNSARRAERIMELVDVAGKEVYDFGCSVGTMSATLASRAKRVIGVDYDNLSIKVAQSVYNSNTEFRCVNLSMEFLDSIPATDVVVWTSQFMWMVEQQGMDYALDFLWKLSTKCDVLVFETAGKNDGSAPLDLRQDEIFRILCQNTVFKDITDHGPWNDGWTPRNVFVCKNPFSTYWGQWSTVTAPRRGVIRKTFKGQPFSNELKLREETFLKMLEWHASFPRLLSTGDSWIDMSHEGMRAKFVPEDDVMKILNILEANGISHRDIRPENVLWNGYNAVLIDFSFAVRRGEVTNYHYDLGGKYKCPYGFNDEYSLRKVQQELLCKN